MDKLISIIIPCYNEENNLDKICKAVRQIMNEQSGYQYEMLLVNDGSKDHTLQKMIALAGEDKNIRY